MHKILIVEQDRALNNGIALALKAESYLFLQAFGLKEADELLKKQKVELVILDLNLPDGDEVEFLKNIKETYHIPVVILTGRDMEEAAAAGLESGADDYITKPFSLMALRARVNNQIRKTRSSRLQVYQSRDFYFSFQRMEFSKGDRKVDLSRTEQKLLQLLVENRGLTLSRNELVERIWADSTQYADENALTVLVKRLRDERGSWPRVVRASLGGARSSCRAA